MLDIGLLFGSPITQSMDGPIVYVFNTIQGILRINMGQITDVNTLTAELLDAITSIMHLNHTLLIVASGI